MESPHVLDLTQLIAPLEGNGGVGEDLRNDASPSSASYAIRDARTAARTAERQLMMGGEPAAPPDWRPVLNAGVKLLGERSKDLEITAYTIEALVRLHGFAGLRDGFRLARELVSRFWDGLYPLPDEDGMETRVAPLAGLNGVEAEGTLINPISRVPLTQGNAAGPFALCHYQQALMVAEIKDDKEREARTSQGAVSMALVEQAVAETPAAFFRTVVEDVNACLAEFAGLGQALDEKCGNDAPPASNIRQVLNSCLDAVRHIAGSKLAAEPSAAAERLPESADDFAVDGGQDGAAAGRSDGAFRNREEAFGVLLKLADFFRRTEPHSPVSYAVERAVRWGRMSLPELLNELIDDDPVRAGCFKQVGIDAPEKS
jgi:type VI secretion system protein ImpA